VGTDDGKIYKISCVFKCALNSQPTVLWTFNLPVAGTGGAAATPNGSVYDFPSGHLFVGDQLGELWVINAKSAATPTLAAGPVMIGGGGCTAAHPPGRTGTGTDCNASGGSFGIPDSILFDSNSISGRVYAFSGNDGTAGASAVVAQLASDLTGLVRVHVGRGSVGNITTDVDIHSGDFDNKYLRHRGWHDPRFFLLDWIHCLPHHGLSYLRHCRSQYSGRRSMYSDNRNLQSECEFQYQREPATSRHNN
jgi:hypothetical protein